MKRPGEVIVSGMWGACAGVAWSHGDWVGALIAGALAAWLFRVALRP
jgi:hypothetical protein